MSTVTVIDAIMGAGKTSFILEQINASKPSDRFIFITPYIDEVERVIKTVNHPVYSPNANDNDSRTKLQSMKNAIIDGKSIVSTHSLFTLADDELISMLKRADYSLILDEVMDVVEGVNISQGDVHSLIAKEYVKIEDDGKVIWMDDSYTGKSFRKVQKHAKSGSLYFLSGKYLIWAYPPRIFNVFDHVYVLTYLFEGSSMRQYFDIYGIDYEIMSVRGAGDFKRRLTSYDRHSENREEIYKLIELYEGDMNDNTNEFYLSSTWLKRNVNKSKGIQMQRNLVNWFCNMNKDAESSQRYWTTLKDAVQPLKGKGYASRWIPFNIRATNAHADCFVLAYVYNRFLHPDETTFFTANDRPIDEDLRALSDLLQWVWRSRIRNGEPIRLYLPSMRMRRLLKQWANYEI